MEYLLNKLFARLVLLILFCEVRPAKNQVDDLIYECKKIVKKIKSPCNCLNKKMAEDLTEYMNEQGIKVRYLHSDIDTLERIEILKDLRTGLFDVLVGINLLRRILIYPSVHLLLF